MSHFSRELRTDRMLPRPAPEAARLGDRRHRQTCGGESARTPRPHKKTPGQPGPGFEFCVAYAWEDHDAEPRTVRTSRIRPASGRCAAPAPPDGAAMARFKDQTHEGNCGMTILIPNAPQAVRYDYPRIRH